jgi:hypothetical protein
LAGWRDDAVQGHEGDWLPTLAAAAGRTSPERLLQGVRPPPGIIWTTTISSTCCWAKGRPSAARYGTSVARSLAQSALMTSSFCSTSNVSAGPTKRLLLRTCRASSTSAKTLSNGHPHCRTPSRVMRMASLPVSSGVSLRRSRKLPWLRRWSIFRHAGSLYPKRSSGKSTGHEGKRGPVVAWPGRAHITAGFHASPTKPRIPSCDPGPHLFSIGLEQLLWQQRPFGGSRSQELHVLCFMGRPLMKKY